MKNLRIIAFVLLIPFISYSQSVDLTINACNEICIDANNCLECYVPLKIDCDKGRVQLVNAYGDKKQYNWSSFDSPLFANKTEFCDYWTPVIDTCGVYSGIASLDLTALIPDTCSVLGENKGGRLALTSKTFAANTYNSISILVDSGVVDIILLNLDGNPDTIPRSPSYTTTISHPSDCKLLQDSVVVDATTGAFIYGVIK